MKANWGTQKLGEVCDFYNGLWIGKEPPYVRVGVIRNTNFSKESLLDDSNIAYLEVEKKQFLKRKLKCGDLILEKSGGGPKQAVGRVIIFDKKKGDFSFSNFTSAIRVKDKKVLDFNFLYLFLLHSYISGVTEKMQSHSTGIRNLDLHAYKEINVPIPPLSKQVQLVGILWKLLAEVKEALDITELNKLNSRKLLLSYIERAFASQEGYRSCVLKDLVVFKGGGTPSKSNNKYWEGDIPWVSPKDMKCEVISDTIDHISGQAVDASATQLVPKDSVLVVVRSGILARTIPIAIAGRELTINQDMKALIPDHSVVPKLLYYALKGSEETLLGKVNKGATVHRLQTKFLENLVINFPPSLAEQKILVKRLDTLSAEAKKMEQIYERKLSSLEELKRSLLCKAFTGSM